MKNKVIFEEYLMESPFFFHLFFPQIQLGKNKSDRSKWYFDNMPPDGFQMITILSSIIIIY